MSGTFSNILSVATLVALKAIENPPPDAIRAARDTSPAGDGSRDAGWYVFRFGDTATESLPDIVTPTVGNGRWRAFVGGDVSGGGEAVIEASDPSRAPEFPGEFWINVDTGTSDPDVQGIWIGVLVSGSLSGLNSLNVGGGAWQRIV